MNKNYHGICAEKIFQARCLKNNITLFEPVSPFGKVDVIVCGNKLYRCQVKICSFGKGESGKMISVRHNRRGKARKRSPYQSSEIDMLVGVDVETNDVYIVPIEFLEKNRYKSAVSASILAGHGFINNFDIF